MTDAPLGEWYGLIDKLRWGGLAPLVSLAMALPVQSPERSATSRPLQHLRLDGNQLTDFISWRKDDDDYSSI